ncbi:MAG: hypothetical protein WCD35_09315 [Mycobacteriales bacterium]
MIKKLTLLTGVGVGYVLGTRAGTERYDQLRRVFDDLRRKPPVQHATSAVTDAVQGTASELAGKVTSKVTGKVSSMVDGATQKASHRTVDLDQARPVAAPDLSAR